MAKVIVVFLTLVMLGVWGWMAWGEYVAGPRDAAIHTTPYRDAQGFAGFLAGIDPIITIDFPEGGFAVSTIDFPWEEGRANLCIALGAIVAFSATLFFAVTAGSGGIFSVMITAFIAFFTAAANMVFALSLLVRTGWALFGSADPVEYQLGVFGIALYGLLSVVTAFTMMRQMPNLVRGRRPGMHAVFKCLLILLIACAGLAPLGLPTEFVVYGYHGAYALAALCLLSLMFIGMTYGNYQYD